MVRANNYGRLGNVYWQVAVAISYALEHGLEFSVQNRTTHEFWNPLYLQHLVNPKWQDWTETVVVKEPHFHYAPIPWDESWRGKNIILDGYWQSWIYIKDHIEDIVRLFNHRHCYVKKCSIHARFTDYLTIEGKHILMNEEYLVEAMSVIMKRTGISKFKVFSDDIPYFKNHFGKLYNFEYSENTDIVKDFEEISWCAHNINSSSTFSQWAALLNRNPDKIVITPKEWFRGGWDNADTSTIVPPEWVKV